MTHECMTPESWATFFQMMEFDIITWTYDVIVVKGNQFFFYVREGAEYCIQNGEPA